MAFGGKSPFLTAVAEALNDQEEDNRAAVSHLPATSAPSDFSGAAFTEVADVAVTPAAHTRQFRGDETPPELQHGPFFVVLSSIYWPGLTHGGGWGHT